MTTSKSPLNRHVLLHYRKLANAHAWSQVIVYESISLTTPLYGRWLGPSIVVVMHNRRQNHLMFANSSSVQYGYLLLCIEIWCRWECLLAINAELSKRFYCSCGSDIWLMDQKQENQGLRFAEENGRNSVPFWHTIFAFRRYLSYGTKTVSPIVAFVLQLCLSKTNCLLYVSYLSVQRQFVIKKFNEANWHFHCGWRGRQNTYVYP